MADPQNPNGGNIVPSGPRNVAKPGDGPTVHIDSTQKPSGDLPFVERVHPVPATASPPPSPPVAPPKPPAAGGDLVDVSKLKPIDIDARGGARAGMEFVDELPRTAAVSPTEAAGKKFPKGKAAIVGFVLAAAAGLVTYLMNSEKELTPDQQRRAQEIEAANKAAAAKQADRPDLYKEAKSPLANFIREAARDAGGAAGLSNLSKLKTLGLEKADGVRIGSALNSISLQEKMATDLAKDGKADVVLYEVGKFQYKTEQELPEADRAGKNSIRLSFSNQMIDVTRTMADGSPEKKLTILVSPATEALRHADPAKAQLEAVGSVGRARDAERAASKPTGP